MSRTAVDPRLVNALLRQHRRRSALLTSGATHVGWKIGGGRRERVGGQVVIGYLTSHSLHRSGDVFKEWMEEPRAEVEVAVDLGAPIEPGDDATSIRSAIVGFRSALEICDIARPRGDDAELIVEENVFHNALALGPAERTEPQGRASIHVNGVMVGTAPIKRDLVGLLGWAAALLHTLDLHLEPGDVIITGGLVNVPVGPGDHVTAQLDGLEDASLDLA
jgi:2-keto-4-pentenoate hydratase